MLSSFWNVKLSIVIIKGDMSQGFCFFRSILCLSHHLLALPEHKMLLLLLWKCSPFCRSVIDHRTVWGSYGPLWAKSLGNVFRQLPSEIQGILLGSSWQVLELKILLFKFLYAYFHLEYSSHFSKMLAFCLIEALLTVSLRKQPTFRDLNTGFPANWWNQWWSCEIILCISS